MNKIREKILEKLKNNKRVVVYCDMDGVVADFEGGALENKMEPHEFKLKKGAYFNLKPYKYAFEVLKAIEKQLGVEIYMLTKIPDENPYSATEKLLWLAKYAKERSVNVIISPDKGCVGSEDDFLIDDRPHKAKVKDFRGTFLYFGENGKFKDFKDVAEYFGVDFNFQ